MTARRPSGPSIRGTRLVTTAMILLMGSVLPLPAQVPRSSDARPHELGDATVHIGPNVHVSRDHARYPLGETLLTADPEDPDRLLGCGIVYATDENRRWTAVYLSTDGGRSWRSTLETRNWEDSADPACTPGPGGVAHHVAIGFQWPERYVLGVWRSDDGGRSWQEQEPVSMKHQGIDRESIVADVTDGEYRGRVYVTGESSIKTTDGSRTATNGMGVWVSTDGGRTFGGPLKLLSPGTGYTLGVGNSVITSDGTLVSVFGELKHYDSGGGVEDNRPGESNAILNVITSSDGGESLSTAIKVDDYYMVWPPTPADAAPTIAVDRWSDPFRDRLYVTWTDERSGRAETYFSYSTDTAKTWTRPVVISDAPPFPDADGPNTSMPTIAVNRDGVVGVMWYDRRHHPDGMGWDIRFRASLDGGETWMPSVEISEASNVYGEDASLFTGATVRGGGSGGYNRRAPPADGPLTLAVYPQGRQFNAGDYAGLAADVSGRFHGFWIDNRTGLPQIWTAAVTVSGPVGRHGGGELAALDDVSAKVSFQVRDSRFDRAARQVRLTARLENTSKETLRGPFKVRVVGLDSQLAAKVSLSGRPVTDGGPGAVIDFTDVVDGGALRPGETSDPLELAIELDDLRPFRQDGEYRFGLVSPRVRVLARHDKSDAPSRR